MEFLEGISLNRKEELLKNPNYDAEKTIKTYLNATVRHWFRDDYESYPYQADPHLSNILALPHGDVACVDYGLISELSRKEASQSRYLMIAVYLQDLHKALQIAIEMTGGNFQTHAPLIEADIKAYLEKTPREGFGFWFLEFAKIMVRHKLKFPLYLTTFGRTNVMLDGLINSYFPEKTTSDMVGKELKRQAMKESIKNIINADWLKLTYVLSEQFNQAPQNFGELISNPRRAISEFIETIRKAA